MARVKFELKVLMPIFYLEVAEHVSFLFSSVRHAQKVKGGSLKEGTLAQA